MIGKIMVKKLLLTIDELAKETGVSTRTIRFYSQERLLPPPREFKGRVALYNSEHIEKIRLIKALKERHFLPLAVIKEIIQRPETIAELEKDLRTCQEIYSVLKRQPPTIKQKELVETSGLSISMVIELEKKGFLHPTLREEGKVYTAANLQIAKLVKELLNKGFTVEELSFIPRLLKQIAELAINLGSQKFLNLVERGDERVFSMIEQVARINEELLGVLYRRLMQQAVEDYHVAFLKGEKK
jgi:DNA-binding transcriptional MerR regulator